MITTYDDLVARISNEFDDQLVGVSNYTTAKSTVWQSPGGPLAAADLCVLTPTKSLPSGVTGYIPTEVLVVHPTQGIAILIAELVDLGSIDISGASGTFTDGSSLGTQTEGGAAGSNIFSSVWMEATTALNANPGTLVVTYVDQDGNTAEASPSMTLTGNSVAGSGSWLLLNNPDVAVRDITAAVRSGGTTPSGVIKFWGVKPIALVPSSGPNAAPFSLLNNGIVRRLPAGANIVAISASNAAAGATVIVNIVGDN